jgi:hypothetical protein
MELATNNDNNNNNAPIWHSYILVKRQMLRGARIWHSYCAVLQLRSPPGYSQMHGWNGGGGSGGGGSDGGGPGSSGLAMTGSASQRMAPQNTHTCQPTGDVPARGQGNSHHEN